MFHLFSSPSRRILKLHDGEEQSEAVEPHRQQWRHSHSYAVFVRPGRHGQSTQGYHSLTANSSHTATHGGR